MPGEHFWSKNRFPKIKIGYTGDHSAPHIRIFVEFSCGGYMAVTKLTFRYFNQIFLNCTGQLNMLDRSLVGFRSILVEWQLKTNFRCYIIWVGPLYTSLLIRGQSAAIRGLDRGGAEGNPRGAAGAGGNPRNPPALQIREARMNRLVNRPGSCSFSWCWVSVSCWW